MTVRKHSVVAIIPARYASSRFPGKSLVEIQGKTLLNHTYDNAKRCGLIERLIVATDDRRIYRHVEEFGGEAMMTPIECPTGSDRLAYVLHQETSLQKADIVINVQGDEPCLDPETLTQLIQVLRKDSEAVMSTAAFPLTDPEEAMNPHVVKCVIDQHGNALYFSRALLPAGRTLKYTQHTPYYKHIGIYAFRPHFLLRYGQLPMTPLQQAEDLEQLKVLEHGYRIKVAIVKAMGPDVNTPEDIKKVEQILCKQNSSLSQAESVRRLAKG